jgi:hypothetical protein
MARKQGYSEDDYNTLMAEYNNTGQRATDFLNERDAARNEVNSLLESKAASAAELAAAREKLARARARNKRLKARVSKLKGKK